jgi:hypothetical protein
MKFAGSIIEANFFWRNNLSTMAQNVACTGGVLHAAKKCYLVSRITGGSLLDVLISSTLRQPISFNRLNNSSTLLFRKTGGPPGP